jgi:hypothetical protein
MYSEGVATRMLETVFFWVSVVLKQMLRWFLSSKLSNVPQAALQILMNPNGIPCCGVHKILFQNYEIYNWQIKILRPLIKATTSYHLKDDALFFLPLE